MMKAPDYQTVERLWRRTITMLLLLFSVHAGAAEIEVTVLDRHGDPVPDVAVYIEQNQTGVLAANPNPSVMQLTHFQFEPEMLVVQSGTRVDLPNNDVVAHHVYSFSKPNNFVLPMFNGGMRPQIELKQSGVVIIGCNLHDNMVGYILVVDSHVFGKTRHDGKIVLEAENLHGITVRIWSPRIRLDDEDLAQSVKAGRSAQLTFLLKEELRSARALERVLVGAGTTL